MIVAWYNANGWNNLHSNLGIFKLLTLCIMILFLKKFTFQSGDIQILERMLARRNLEPKFTFQSGDIQIGKDKKFEELYDLFTFQSGDIQILGLCQKYIMTLFIYIPIW